MARSGQIEVRILRLEVIELLALVLGDGAVLVLKDEVVAADDDPLTLTRLAMPWATIYSTSECISSWEMPRSLASRTTALAIEWGKCSSRQAASCKTSRSLQPEKGRP